MHRATNRSLQAYPSTPTETAWYKPLTIAKPQSQVMAEYSTPVYPHGTGPPAITDQITDQNTPYCDELRYAVSNDIRMLVATQRRDKE